MRCQSRICFCFLLISLHSRTVPAQTAAKPLPTPKLNNTIASRPLLLETSVQKDLGLTDKQVNRLQQIESSAAEANQVGLSMPMEDGEEGFDFNEMMVNAEESSRQKRAAILKVLTPAQRTRLVQLDWQRDGWLALARADVAKKIKLASPQQQKIQAIILKMRQAQSNTLVSLPAALNANPRNAAVKNLNPANGFIDPNGQVGAANGLPGFGNQDPLVQDQKSSESSQKLLAAAQKEVEAILTDDQKLAFEQLLGPSFNFNTMTDSSAKDTNAPATTKSRKSAAKKTAKKP